MDEHVIRLMPTIEDILPILGSRLDEQVIQRLFGRLGQYSSNEIDPAHPEDQRHYYSVPQFGFQCVLGENGTIRTIFLHIEGDADVSPYPWSFKIGLTSSSTRQEALALLGNPERSGRASQFAPGGWDRFAFGSKLLHLQYNEAGMGISMITAMKPEAAPGGA
jgi:hypothetical protein